MICACRHDGRVPDRVARADGDAAATEAAVLLRSVIEVAIMRPGPIQGDMVHPYLRRRCGRGARHLSERRRREVLERTLGVPIFQEQVMQLAIVAAGFTRGRSRPAAPRDGRVAAQRRTRAFRATADRRHARARLRRGVRERASSARSRDSASMAFPNRTRRASRCWSMFRHGSSVTSPRHSAARCSTASRWASMRRSNSCGTRASTASRCGPSTSTRSDWDCTLELRDCGRCRALRLGLRT